MVRPEESEMREFKSWGSFSTFSWVAIRKHRFVRSAEMEEFLTTVLLTSKSRQATIKPERIFWRAQIGSEFRPYYQEGEFVADLPAPYSPERMKPSTGESSEGRANPKGIPYLYLATHRDTALAEVRPWLGALISVAQFKTMRKLKVINCSGTEDRHLIYLEEPEPPEREKAVWCDIDRAFSKPITSGDKTADYVPTQIIADLFRANGFDGIVYRSALGEGHNVALFDLDAAELINCSLFEAKEIKYEFSQAASPYFVKKHYEARLDRHRHARKQPKRKNS
jgi:hypothetical protein